MNLHEQVIPSLQLSRETVYIYGLTKTKKFAAKNPDSFWLKLSLFPLPSGAVKRNHDQKIFDFTLIVFHEYLFVSSIKKIGKLKLLYSN